VLAPAVDPETAALVASAGVSALSGRIELTGNAAIVVDPFVANFVSFFFWILLGELVPSLHR